MRYRCLTVDFKIDAAAAVQLGRVMDRSLSNDMTSAMVDIEPSSRTLRILQGHAILSFNNGYTTKQVCSPYLFH